MPKSYKSQYNIHCCCKAAWKSSKSQFLLMPLKQAFEKSITLKPGINYCCAEPFCRYWNNRVNWQVSFHRRFLYWVMEAFLLWPLNFSIFYNHFIACLPLRIIDTKSIILLNRILFFFFLIFWWRKCWNTVQKSIPATNHCHSF